MNLFMYNFTLFAARGHAPEQHRRNNSLWLWQPRCCYINLGSLGAFYSLEKLNYTQNVICNSCLSSWSINDRVSYLFSVLPTTMFQSYFVRREPEDHEVWLAFKLQLQTKKLTTAIIITNYWRITAQRDIEVFSSQSSFGYQTLR